MTMNMAVFVTFAILTIWAAIMVAWTIRSKKQDKPEFSFIAHLRTMKISMSQYEKLASDARILMYLYVFVCGVELGKGNVSMAVSAGFTFLLLQAALFLIKSKWVSFNKV